MTVNAGPTQNTASTDRIEKNVVINAPRSRVWRAIANADEFGTWFRMNLDGEFAEGETIFGRITHAGYEHVKVEMKVERIEPERYFAYRWHPYAIESGVDYSAEPMTLVEFILEEEGDGTAVTIVESGFDRVPVARRAEAFRMNDKGWTGQIQNIVNHVS
jgi:uncharacterized protein YndB with AHSA1/START domain